MKGIWDHGKINGNGYIKCKEYVYEGEFCGGVKEGFGILRVKNNGKNGGI